MNQRVLTLTLALAVTLGVVGPSPACAQSLPVFTASSSTVSVANNSYFLVALPSNPTTGYNWSSKGFSQPGIVQLVGSGFVPSTSGLLGAGGTYVCVLKATGTGTTTLTLIYARSFGNSASTIQKFQITVTP